MAILKKPESKKPESKKRACQYPLPVTGISALVSAGRTLAPTSEERAMRREINRLQVATMTADLRLHNAQADMAEFTAARAHAELKDYLAQRAKLAKK